MKKDILQLYHEFAKQIADVAPPPPQDGYNYGVMIVVHSDGKEPPVGGALNFIKGKWVVQAEMGEFGPVVQ